MTLVRRLLPARGRALFRVAAAAVLGSVAAASHAPPDDPPTPPAGALLARLPLRFVANRGQFDARLGFVAQGGGRAVGVGDGGIRYALADGGRRAAVDVAFLGARTSSAACGVDPTATRVNYFRGPRADWITDVPVFGGVAVEEAWPGVDVVVTGERSRVKTEFRVAAGADPSAIALAWRGAERVSLGDDGALRVTTTAGPFDDAAPVAWQERGGVREPVDVTTSLRRLADGAFVQTFALGAFDRSRALVIDPAVVVYAGFLAGASGEETGNDVAVDASGSAYVVGRTRFDAASFPAAGGVDPTHNGGMNDAFIAKLTPAGDDLVYAGFIGGSGEDSAIALAVDDLGAAYVTGRTTSTEASFPIAGGVDPTANGMTDAFLVKLAPRGDDIEWGGFLGGNEFDEANALALDADRNLYVAGATSSRESSFPVAVGPSLTFVPGPAPTTPNAFVAKVKADGSGLAYAGYIGGAGTEESFGIAVDAAGAAYVTGYTGSDATTFPLKKGPCLTFGGGTADVFAAKVAPGGASLEWCGYIGGAGHEVGYGVAPAPDGSVWIAGHTASPQTSFPVLKGPSLTHGGEFDAFVAHVAADGASLLSCGYVGGAKFDAVFGAAPDHEGGVWIAGYTGSAPADGFPVPPGAKLEHKGAMDGFVAHVRAADASLDRAWLIGGRATEYLNGVAVGADGAVYVTGSTESDAPGFPSTVGPVLTRRGDGACSFVAKFQEEPVPVLTEGWMVPTRVRLTAGATASADGTLIAAGEMECVAAASGLGGPLSLAIGRLDMTLPAAERKGAALVYTAPGLTLRITPAPGGRSRARFALRLRRALADVNGAEAPLALRLKSGGVRARGEVPLVEGRFAAGRWPARAIGPSFRVTSARAALGDDGGAFSFAAQVRLSGPVPAAAPDVRVAFAGFGATVPSASFVRRGGVFVHRGRGPGVRRIVLDWAARTILVEARGAALGDLAEGLAAVRAGVTLGADVRAARIGMVRRGRRLAD